MILDTMVWQQPVDVWHACWGGGGVKVGRELWPALEAVMARRLRRINAAAAKALYRDLVACAEAAASPVSVGRLLVLPASCMHQVHACMQACSCDKGPTYVPLH